MTRRVFSVLLALAGMLLFLPSCQSYDQLVEKDQVAQQKWADYEAQLQRRADLIPRLVNTVKGAASFESSTLEKITQARASAGSIKLSGDDFSDPAKVKSFEEAQAKINYNSINNILRPSEAYPKLQASAQFTDLMKELEGTENRILRSREQYNEAVKDYNSELNKIRGTAVNKATGQPFKPRVYFAATSDATAAPAVSF